MGQYIEAQTLFHSMQTTKLYLRYIYVGLFVALPVTTIVWDRFQKHTSSTLETYWDSLEFIPLRMKKNGNFCAYKSDSS